MEGRIGVYAGTFDIFTNGHMWVVNEAKRLFSVVYILVAANPEKKQGAFTVDERVKIIEELFKDDSQVVVETYAGYTAKFVSSLEDATLIRGIRSPEDYSYELTVNRINAGIEPETHSLYLLPPKELSDVSSSAIRALMQVEGWEQEVGKYVPTKVLNTLMLNSRFLQIALRRYLNPFYFGDGFTDNILSYALNHAALPYHNLTHVARLMKILAKATPNLQLAALYHDFVYEIGSDTNEKDSAEYVGELFKFLNHSFPAGNPDVNIETVKGLILATKNCFAEKEALSPEQQTMLDVDLSILGTHPEEYKRYKQAIAKEYEKAPLPLFFQGRVGFLKNMLAKKSIFYTDFFVAGFEKQARENITQEIAEYGG